MKSCHSGILFNTRTNIDFSGSVLITHIYLPVLERVLVFYATIFSRNLQNSFFSGSIIRNNILQDLRERESESESYNAMDVFKVSLSQD